MNSKRRRLLLVTPFITIRLRTVKIARIATATRICLANAPDRAKTLFLFCCQGNQPAPAAAKHRNSASDPASATKHRSNSSSGGTQSARRQSNSASVHQYTVSDVAIPLCFVLNSGS